MLKSLSSSYTVMINGMGGKIYFSWEELVREGFSEKKDFMGLEWLKNK